MFYSIQYYQAIAMMRDEGKVDAARLREVMEYDESGTLTTSFPIERHDTTLMIINHPELPEAVMKFVTSETFFRFITTTFTPADRRLKGIYIGAVSPTVVVLQDEYEITTIEQGSGASDDDDTRQEIQNALGCLSLTWEGMFEEVSDDVQSYPSDPSNTTLVEPNKYKVVVATIVIFPSGSIRNVSDHTKAVGTVEKMRYELEEMVQWSMWEEGHDAFRAKVVHVDSTFTVVGK